MNRKELASKALREAGSGLLVVLTMAQYIAYYEGLGALIGDTAGRFIVVIALVVTFMFRLDIIATAVGFYGAWQVWHLPLWVAVLMSAAFESMSYAVNYGPGKKPVSLFRSLWPMKKPSAPKNA